MKEVVSFLNENPVQYFATVGLDGKAKVRPFQFMIEKDSKLYFCTNSKKEVCQEVKTNPYVEVSVSTPAFEWIRLSGKVVFSDDLETKADVIKASALVKSIYQTPENPIFEIFYLDEAKAVIADFSGNASRNYQM